MRVVAQFEFPMASLLVVAGVIPSTSSGQALSAAVLQAGDEPALSRAEGISRYDAVCHGRSLGPLVKTRALRDDALSDSKFKFSHYRDERFQWWYGLLGLRPPSQEAS
jgi:hypothetical protein